MYYLLMYKDEKVAICKSKGEGSFFKQTHIIVDTIEEKLLPLGMVKDSDGIYDITKWIYKRIIPQNRTNYQTIVSKLNEHHIDLETAFFKCHGMTIKDNYWIYPLQGSYVTNKIKLKCKFLKDIPKFNDISLANNHREQGLFQNIINNQPLSTDNLLSADITTGGKTQKYWVKRNDKLLLVKQNDAVCENVAEREIIASFVMFLLNDCRNDAKKKPIKTVNYQFEKGVNKYMNCTFCESFAVDGMDVATYDELTASSKSTNSYYKFKDFLDTKSGDIQGVKETLEYIIVLDYLIENYREEDDIAYYYDPTSRNNIMTAPVYGITNSLGYMNKDFTRANKQQFTSKHVNVFNMDERQQVKYISENIDWFLPEMLYRKSDILLEYLSSKDVDNLTRQQRNNIADWFKYKIVVLADARRKIAIAQEMENDDKYERAYHQNDDEDEYDDDDEEYDDGNDGNDNDRYKFYT